MYNRRQNLKTCLNKNRGMFANLAGTGAQPFCRYVSSASRADITGDGKVSSLAPDPSMPQVPPARECCIQERKSEKQKKEFQKRRKPGNNSAHDCMRTWLHSALSSPAGHQGLSHVQQNYTDVPQRGNNMVPGSQIRTDLSSKRSYQSFSAKRGSVAPKNKDMIESRSVMNNPDNLAGGIHVNDQGVVALALSGERQSEYADQRPLRFGCTVHVVLLVVIGNSWLWDKHWYENK